jgi:hypothetical protein|tara:strand:+ start:60 stop:650 length:591 start_codon:yes stop_codon:yes gene_type:complete
MKVLIACEYSGKVRDAFAKKGHDALSCDLLASDQPNGNHHQGDIREVLYRDWDLIIAHPPCTYFANSGVSWLHRDKTRWRKLDESAEFFNLFLKHPCRKVAIENPVPHKYALERIGNIKYTQTIQPWQFGDDASKRTCLWLKNLPKLVPTNIIKKERYSNQTPSGQNNIGPSENRWKQRSVTYQGIADAMAQQWGT